MLCLEREREKVNWCFTPSQPVRLYQGDRERDRDRERERESIIIHAWISLRGYLYVQLCTSVDREPFLKFGVLRPANQCGYIRAIERERHTHTQTEREGEHYNTRLDFIAWLSIRTAMH